MSFPPVVKKVTSRDQVEYYHVISGLSTDQAFLNMFGTNKDFRPCLWNKTIVKGDGANEKLQPILKK